MFGLLETESKVEMLLQMFTEGALLGESVRKREKKLSKDTGSAEI